MGRVWRRPDSGALPPDKRLVEEGPEVDAVKVVSGPHRLKDRLPVELPDVVLAQGHRGETLCDTVEGDLVGHHLLVRNEDLPLGVHLSDNADHSLPTGEDGPARLFPEI